MKLGYNLALNQVQKLVMTPELRQAIQLLQFNSQELNEYLNQEIEENPMLEPVNTEIEHESLDQQKDKKDDIDWKDFVERYDDISYRPQGETREEEYSYDNFVGDSISLKEHLLFQLNTSHLKGKELRIGKTIIEDIDSNGYLIVDICQIAKDLETDIVKVEEILSIIQSFDPLGVGCRDLKECLLIQVKGLGFNKPNIENIIKDYLDDIAHNRLSKIAKELNIDPLEAQEISDIIKTLEPKPGRSFESLSNGVKYISPDASIDLIDGEYVITLNDITAPRLNINKFYRDMIKKENDIEATEFLKEKLSSALWVIKSIEQRRMTIYNVIKSILKFQINFFEHGEKALIPLTLKEIADDINMHESTVSRATNGKYVQTPRGLFELKYFFSSGLSNKLGDEISSTSIKAIIKDIIEGEDSKKPYSDQKISDILKGKNVKISRRTVAKYRDELEIPSSSLRKRY